MSRFVVVCRGSSPLFLGKCLSAGASLSSSLSWKTAVHSLCRNGYGHGSFRPATAILAAGSACYRRPSGGMCSALAFFRGWHRSPALAVSLMCTSVYVKVGDGYCLPLRTKGLAHIGWPARRRTVILAVYTIVDRRQQISCQLCGIRSRCLPLCGRRVRPRLVRELF